jgi:hypothetical protein
LVGYNTVSSYPSTNVSLTCNEIVAKISNFRFDNERCLRIKFGNDVNSTLLYVDIGGLNVAYASNYFNLNDGQRQNVQSMVTSLMILVNEYNQHSVTLVMAIYKYARLYIDLLFNKKTYCNCPTVLSSSSSSALATVDSNLRDIQASVDSRETNIRTKSLEVLSKVAAINPDLKKTSTFVHITTTLDSITTLITGYQQLTTTDVINSTTNCDDAAIKVAFLQYKFDLYFQMNVEAARNATFVLFYLNNLNAYYIVNYFQLSAAQKSGVEGGVIASMKSLILEFSQYILTLSISLVKLALELFNAKVARSGSCNCMVTSDGISTAVLTSASTTTSELKLFPVF